MDSNLWQIFVPEEFLNKTFGQLFLYLLADKNMICLGLYRLSGALDNSHPYCYTNPDSDVKLTHRDKVFVLSYNMPPELCKLQERGHLYNLEVLVGNSGIIYF